MRFFKRCLARACYCQTISVIDWLHGRLQRCDICLGMWDGWGARVSFLHEIFKLHMTQTVKVNVISLTTRTFHRLIIKYGFHPGKCILIFSCHCHRLYSCMC